MGADRWVKSAAGLLVPNRKLAAPFRFMPCEDCCDPPSPCPCGLCNEIPPCCWTVTISGITDGNCLNCRTCFNGIFVASFRNSCTWRYQVPWFLFTCAANGTLEVRVATDLIDDTTKYRYEVELSGVATWATPWTTEKPDCGGEFVDNFSLVSSEAECSVGSATVTIQAEDDTEPTDCPDPTTPNNCDGSCVDGVGFSQNATMTLIFEGLVNTPGCPCNCEDLNGVFELAVQVGGCRGILVGGHPAATTCLNWSIVEAGVSWNGCKYTAFASIRGGTSSEDPDCHSDPNFAYHSDSKFNCRDFDVTMVRDNINDDPAHHACERDTGTARLIVSDPLQ